MLYVKNLFFSYIKLESTIQFRFIYNILKESIRENFCLPLARLLLINFFFVIITLPFNISSSNYLASTLMFPYTPSS